MKNVTADYDFPIAGFEDLEASSQFVIAEAIRRGVKVEVLCRRDLGDKHISKLLLKEAEIAVPEGEVFEKIPDAVDSFERFKKSGVAVKPVDTNSGIGITLLPENDSQEVFREAIEKAFSFSSGILVERLVSGKEYRFLVIDNQLIAVAHRKPANVIGDGVQSVSELVAEKNADPRRGEQYRAPLQSLVLGEVERKNLAEVGLSIDDVPAEGQEVLLRKNSNLSTGGDSIDMTDDVHPGYKDIAIRATQVAGAKICGVDIIIEDVSEEPSAKSYAIIELNYNPGLRAHRYPHTGTPRFVECPILDLLGFPEIA
jgi:glutamate--cysteine ligase